MAAANRNGLLAKVHIAKKDLGLSDEDYRDLLDEKFGRRSAGKLTIPQLAELLNHFLRKGWAGGARRAPARKKPAPGKQAQKKKADSGGFIRIPDSDPHVRQKRYILALWKKLGFEVSGLDTRCRTQFKVERFAWIQRQSQLQTLAKDLVSRCVRLGIDYEP